MRIIADLHIHSKYSRATSKDMDIPHLAQWAKWKGIDIVGTGDFTHPMWMDELKKYLKPAGYGFYEYEGVKFILTAEICNIFSFKGTSKRIHNLVIAPSFEVVEEINKELGYIGNLSADGRPMLGFAAKELVRLALDKSPDCMVIPCHAWTPWFSLFGASSGFDRIEDCFQEETKNIFAIETGLSSDPAMNWRLSALDKITLVSNSDAHSPAKLGREANIFDCDMDYKEIMRVLKTQDSKRFLYTLEFFPEEGKYHWDGHRNCKVRQHPGETKEKNYKCPVCNRSVTVGVMHRVDKLADREEGFAPESRPGFKNMIPLVEIIAEVRGRGPQTAGVESEYKSLIQRFKSEFNILLDMPEAELSENMDPKIADAIIRVRQGKVNIAPGYDGEYGKISIFRDDEEKPKTETQMELF